ASTLEDIGDRFELGVAFLPTPDGVERGGVVIGGGSIWMSKGFSEEEMEAAWKFLRHLTSPESTAYWPVTTGYFPIDRRAYALPRRYRPARGEPPDLRYAGCGDRRVPRGPGCY